jgi:renalase
MRLAENSFWPLKRDVVANRVAIVGAGLAGLSCARTLRSTGISVDVFEELSHVGGRIATTCAGRDRFDHGAQYLLPQDNEFRSYLTEISRLGFAERWAPRLRPGALPPGPNGDPWIVGKPGMSSLVRPLADNVRVTLGKRVRSLEQRDNGWHLWLPEDVSVGPFEAVAIAVPVFEAMRLLGDNHPLTMRLPLVRMLPCWALMVRIEEQNFPSQDVFINASEILRWIARDNTKPGRDQSGESLVAHASPAWSIAAEDADADDVAEELWSEVGRILDLPPVRPSRMLAYLWRKGIVERALGQSHLYSSQLRIGVAGDWCLGSYAEHAFTSGRRLGQAIAASLAP